MRYAENVEGADQVVVSHNGQAITVVRAARASGGDHATTATEPRWWTTLREHLFGELAPAHLKSHGG